MDGGWVKTVTLHNCALRHRSVDDDVVGPRHRQVEHALRRLHRHAVARVMGDVMDRQHQSGHREERKRKVEPEVSCL